ncbi:MAG: TetR family transcriptional regulator [Verrucomicrobia bacterium]|nr:TetR family transcriptional regulator [Verrucomicrobiota bacterium]
MPAPLPDRILDATESVVRRYGAEKTNVVDIARALGMSHGNIYRHFPSKQALLDAVAVRLLHPVMVPLEQITNDRSRPSGERLSEWFDTLRTFKRHKVLDDPELFRVHQQVTAHTPEVVKEHVDAVHRQVERIIADGIAEGNFADHLDPRTAARAFLQATSPFHDPALLSQRTPPSDAEARALLDLLLAGLQSGAAPSRPRVHGRSARRRVTGDIPA